MQVNSVTARNATSATPIAGTTTAVVKQKALGQADFLKLLAVQFQTQDPMKPVEDTAFIAQMAQFSALEQTSSLVTQITQLRANQDLATANSYIGRQVTLNIGDGQTVSGEVAGVLVTDGVAKLVVGDQTYALTAVRGVKPGPVATPPATSQSVTRNGA